MAEKGKETVKDTQEVVPKTSEDEGSLAQILEEQVRPTFSGHPAMGEEPGPETVEEEVEVEAKEETKAEPEPELKPKFKYKSQEEAEAAQKEATRAMHEATEAAARERETRAALTAELEALKQSVKETVKEEPPAKPPSADERKARFKAASKGALDKIADLDTEADNYREQVAEAWAEAFAAGGVEAETISRAEVDKIVKDSLKAERETAEVERQRKAKEEEGVRTWERAVDYAEQGGLDMGKGSAEFYLFKSLTQEIPKEYDNEPLKEQVKWVVSEVRKKLAKSTKGMEEVSRDVHTQHSVLGHGTREVKKPPVEKDFTLRGIMDEQRQHRRI